MRYNYKYAMPVDRKVLEYDFESDDSVDDIPEFLKLMRSVDEHTFYKIADEVNSFVGGLWNNIDSQFGINLRDREKLLPIFQEYHRISESFSYIPAEIYRGVYLPSVYGNILEETFGDMIGTVNLKKHKKIGKIFEGLAYGLRSWSNEQYKARGFASYGRERIMFVLMPQEGDVVLDGNALIELTKSIEDRNEDIPFPVDEDEYIVYLKNPKIVHAYKQQDYDRSYWVVIVEEG